MIPILLLFLIDSSLFRVNRVEAAAGINRTVNFQGKIVNKTGGTNVGDGSYTFVFKIYDSSSGGSKLWGDETQTSVPVTNGIFQVALGSVRSFATDSLDFNQDNLWLDITFNGENFGSRIRLAAVPYALTAEKVSGLTVTQTTGTLTIANGKTLTANSTATIGGTDGKTLTLSDSTTLGTNSITLAGGEVITFTAANAVTFTTTGPTSVTLPTSGTLVNSGVTTLSSLTTVGSLVTGTVVGTDTFNSHGIADSGALTFSTGASGDFTITPNGTGNTVLSTTAISGVKVGSSGNVQSVLSVSGGISNTAALIVNNTNSGDLVTASASGTPKFIVSNGGVLTLVGGQTSDIDTIGTSNTLKIGTSSQNGLTLGRIGSATTINGSGLTFGPTAWTATPTISGVTTLTSGFDSNAASTVTSLTADGNSGTAFTVSGTSFTTDIALQNGETIDNHTNGTITFGANSGALTVNLSGTAATLTNSAGNLAVNPSSGTLTSNATTVNFGSAALTVSSCSGCGGGVSSPFKELSGSIIPLNNTEDFLVGAQATTSAKFAVLNIANGTPVASVSSGLNGTGTSIGSNGIIQTASMLPLVLGSATTGPVQLSPKGTNGLYVDGTGRVGINNTNPGYQFDVLSTTTPQIRFGYDTSNYFTSAITSAGAVTFDASGASAGFTFADNVTVSSGGLVLGVTGSAGGSITLDSAGGGISAPTIQTDSSGNLTIQTNQASTTVNVGSGNGNIALSLTHAADALIADKTLTLASSYSNNDYTFKRVITSGSNTTGGALVYITDTGSASGTDNPDLLYIDSELTSGSFTGNLFRLRTATSDKARITYQGQFDLIGGLSTADIDTLSATSLKIGTVNVNALTLSNSGATTTINGSGLTITPTAWTATPTISGLVTATSGLTVAAGQSYTGAGAVTLSSGAGTTLTIDSGTTGAINLGTSANQKTITIGNTTAQTNLIFNAGLTTNNTAAFAFNANGLTTDTAGVLGISATTLSSGTGLQMTVGDPKINNNAGTLTSGKLVNVSSADHSYMSLDNRDLTINGHKNQITLANIQDIYIYDSTKDADGNRWGSDSRAVASSWYNETGSAASASPVTGAACVIGTNTRCGTAAFPDKVIIVLAGAAGANTLYIFDAKDNSLWMSFTQNAGATVALGVNANNTLSSVFAYNGNIYIATNGSAATGLYEINFKSDTITRYNATDGRNYSGNIAARNTAQTTAYPNQNRTGMALISSTVNDVYTQVIGGKTYIAAATGGGTNGGISLVNETSQSVANLGTASKAYQAVWYSADDIVYGLNSTDSELDVWYGGSGKSGNTVAKSTFYDETTKPALWSSAPTINTSTPDALYVVNGTSTVDGQSNTIYVGHNAGMSVIQEKNGDETNGSVKYYTSNMISEEMVGDARAMLPMAGSGTVATGTTITKGTDGDVSVKQADFTTKGTNGVTHSSAVRGTGMTFDGTNYLCTGTTGTCANNSNVDITNTVFSLGFWIKTSSNTKVLVDKQVTAGSSAGYEVQITAAGLIQSTATDGTTAINATSTKAINDGLWHHVVMVENRLISGSACNAANNSCTVTNYIDGIQDGQSAANTSQTGSMTNATQLALMATSAGATFTTGSMDEFFFTGSVLSASEIQHIYQVGARALNNPNHSGTTTFRNVAITADNGNKLNGSSVVKAVRGATAAGNIYVGTSGGVSVIGQLSDTLTDLYSTSINTKDDIGTNYDATNGNAVNTLSAAQGYGTGTVLAIAFNNAGTGGAWMESGDTSLKDFATTNYNPFGSDLTQTNLNVDRVLRVTTQAASNLDDLAIAGTTQPQIADLFRVDSTGAVLNVPTEALNTNTTLTNTYSGLTINALNNMTVNGAGGTSIFNGINTITPNITGTAGTITANGENITIGTITTAGTQNGILITPPTTTNTGGTTTALNIGSITTSNGTDNGIQIGSGWDSSLFYNSTSGNFTLRTLNNGAGAAAGIDLDVGTSSSGAPGISIGTSSNSTGKTITVGATGGTGAIIIGQSTATNTITIGGGTSGATTVNIADASTTSIVSIGNTQTSGTISIGGGSAVRTGNITIGSTGQTSGITLIRGGTGTGAITLTPGTAGTIIIGATGGTGAITLGSSTGAQTVNIGTGAGAANNQAVNIATTVSGGAGINTVTIGSTSTSTNGKNVVIIKAGNNSGSAVAGNSSGPQVTLGNTTSTVAVCSSLAASPTIPTSGTTYELRDCSGTPTADYAENYPVETSASFGDIVATGTEMIDTYGIDKENSGSTDWSRKIGQITKLVKSTSPYQMNTIGIISDNDNDFSSVGYNIKPEDNPMAIALNGRVPVKVATDSQAIQPGDYLTTSGQQGRAMKVTHAGEVIGKALAAWTPNAGQDTVMIFVGQGYYNGVSQSSVASGLEGDPSFTQFISDTAANYLGVQVENGQLVIKATDGSNAITFDKEGNATFSGIITAKEIRADKISGIDVINNEIFALQNQLASQSALATVSAVLGIDTMATSSGNLTLDSLSISGLATVSADFRVKGNSLVEGVLTVIDTLLAKNILVNGTADFFGPTIFHTDVTFQKIPQFSPDTAGLAIVKKGSDHIDIHFTTAYVGSPIVNASMLSVSPSNDLQSTIFSKGYSYIITNVTSNGFTIVVNKPVSDDTTFSWTALMVARPTPTDNTDSNTSQAGN